MKLISFEDIKALGISPETCYIWAEEMIKNKQTALLPAKIHMGLENNAFCNVMPSVLDLAGGKIGGVKVVTRYPQRRASLDSKILLFDAQSGEFISLMDGNWITAMRTGAVAAHSVMTFAKRGFSTLGMIGLGNTARASLMVLSGILKDRPLTVRLYRYKDQAELFAKRFESFKNLNFTFSDSYEDTIRGSDAVISCATYFKGDIAPDDCFDEGMLVVPVHTRGFTNCDLFFDKVYADDTAHVRDFKNFDRFRRFAEVHDVLSGAAKGRESDNERILVYNIGVSMHDVYFAFRIYDMLKELGKLNTLQTLDLKEPQEKFWI